MPDRVRHGVVGHVRRPGGCRIESGVTLRRDAGDGSAGASPSRGGEYADAAAFDAEAAFGKERSSVPKHEKPKSEDWFRENCGHGQ